MSTIDNVPYKIAELIQIPFRAVVKHALDPERGRAEYYANSNPAIANPISFYLTDQKGFVSATLMSQNVELEDGSVKVENVAIVRDASGNSNVLRLAPELRRFFSQYKRLKNERRIIQRSVTITDVESLVNQITGRNPDYDQTHQAPGMQGPAPQPSANLNISFDDDDDASETETASTAAEPPSFMAPDEDLDDDHEEETPRALNE